MSTPLAPIQTVDDGVLLRVRVVTRAKREGLAPGSDRVTVRVGTPPIDGRANRAVRKMLAKAFGVSLGAVTIRSGERGRDKLVHVRSPRRIPEALED